MAGLLRKEDPNQSNRDTNETILVDPTRRSDGIDGPSNRTYQDSEGAGMSADTKKFYKQHQQQASAQENPMSDTGEGLLHGGVPTLIEPASGTNGGQVPQSNPQVS